MTYDPHPNGRPDPGEVVWMWVPYEDDPSRGKDRPVLLIGRDDGVLVGLMMTSQDHDLDQAQETAEGRFCFDIGPGAWDGRGLPSEVRLDRLITVDPEAIRREGAVLDQERFDAVVAALAPHLS
jgi:hypothetical protein